MIIVASVVGGLLFGTLVLMVQTHQPDKAVFRSILPEDIDWKRPRAMLRAVNADPERMIPWIKLGAWC
jgi:hypothetical protein